MTRTSPAKNRKTAKKTSTRPTTKKSDQTPKATTVILVRHGQTPTTGTILPGRTPGLGLSEVGVGQAERAGARLAGLGAADRKPVTALYASPMQRTRETAAPIAKALGLRVRVREGLNECDFGSWTGEKLADLRKLPEWTTVQKHPSGFRFPRGESFPEMQARITGTLAELAGQHPGETIVAVSHADCIKAVMAQALGVHLDTFQRIVISPCSISSYVHTLSGPIVLTVNSTGDDLTSLVPS